EVVGPTLAVLVDRPTARRYREGGPVVLRCADGDTVLRGGGGSHRTGRDNAAAAQILAVVAGGNADHEVAVPGDEIVHLLRGGGVVAVGGAAPGVGVDPGAVIAVGRQEEIVEVDRQAAEPAA